MKTPLRGVYSLYNDLHNVAMLVVTLVFMRLGEECFREVLHSIAFSFCFKPTKLAKKVSGHSSVVLPTIFICPSQRDLCGSK
jgi:hypothetical protein